MNQESASQERQTPEQRYEYGRSLQQQTPVESHADWAPDSRRDDPVALIEAQNTDRVPWLVPERRARMTKSAFTFYRGSARIMASDLANTPSSEIQTQLCGDAHLANFGAYASPERQLVFDLNDFDETLPGPWEWDLKRLATSLFIAGCHNGLNEQQTRKITRRCVKAYRDGISELAKMRLTDIWYDLFTTERLLERLKGTSHYKAAARRIEKFKRQDSRHALDRLAEKSDGQFRIRSQPPLLLPWRQLPDAIRDTTKGWVVDSFEGYRQSVSDELQHLLGSFRIVDFAYKVVGVGSVGTRCAILLLEGRDQSDPLFLQIKQASQSVLEEYLQQSRYQNPAERVVQGQRLMQAANDIFLGWTANKSTGNYYYWRQLKDWKGSIDVDNVNESELKYMADMRGWNLARAHARGGDSIAISGYLDAGKRFDKAITEFSARYADQNDQDYQAYMTEIRSRRLEVNGPASK
jgi:uncharacterized protein (DUF2252 family)